MFCVAQGKRRICVHSQFISYTGHDARCKIVLGRPDHLEGVMTRERMTAFEQFHGGQSDHDFELTKNLYLAEKNGQDYTHHFWHRKQIDCETGWKPDLQSIRL